MESTKSTLRKLSILGYETNVVVYDDGDIYNVWFKGRPEGHAWVLACQFAKMLNAKIHAYGYHSASQGASSINSGILSHSAFAS